MSSLRFRFPLIILVIAILIACKSDQKDQGADVEDVTVDNPVFNETYRPQVHFTPPEKWMNDPNGLVYKDGIYHLFYQHYPEDIVWGPMHWGHAVSADMVSWEHKPIALYPDDLGLIFSGSAVVDENNSSGFGSTENPPLVAVYTYHLMEGEKAGRKDFQTQGIAYSLDNGESWTKYDGNPVIGNEGIKDFRDPKVFWHKESEKWIMALVAGDHVKFYNSSDLKDWTLISEFGKNEGAHGGVWECPDLFKLKVEGSDEEKWVLIISINPGAPNGGSGTQYFVGDFDGTTFSWSEEQTKWLDYGMDNYAGVTYNNTPGGERIFIGWMSNWNYARDTPTQNWRSAMTLPRSLKLFKNDKGYHLRNYPLAQLDKLQGEAIIDEGEINLEMPFVNEALDIDAAVLTFGTRTDINLSITLSNAMDEMVCFQINGETGELLFDRTRSGRVSFEDSFGASIQTQPFVTSEDLEEIRMILDRSSVEVFLGKGKYVFTNQIFPTTPYTKLEISGPNDATLKDLNLHALKSIW